MIVKVYGERVRVDAPEPQVIRVGATGPQGPTGATGVIAATSPVVYSSQTVSLTTDQANGVPVLDANGKLKTAQLPAMSISDTFVVASEAAMLALTAEVGDVAVRTDLSKSLILTASPASTLGNWQELLTPPDTVLSVNDKTGAVQLEASDVGALDAADPSITNARNPVYEYNTWYTNANYTAVNVQSAFFVITATLTASRTFTLPDASTLPDGSEVIIQTNASVSSTVTVTVNPYSGQTINGSATGVVIAAPWAQRRFITAGGAWRHDTGVLRTSSNLSDLASASTARTNLGLGSLATASTITSADITDGTIVNADVNASAAIADSKLNLTTTVTGTAISTTNKIVDAAAFTAGIDRPNGMILYPWFFWNSGNQNSFTPTGDVARATRFVATRDFTVTKIAFWVSGAATNNDNIQVAILNSAGTTVHASSTAGALGVNSTGMKTATLSSSYKLTRGTTYYAALAYDYVSGTGASILCGNAGTGSTNIFGNTVGTSDSLLASGVTTITGSTFTGTHTSAIIPFFILFDN